MSKRMLWLGIAVLAFVGACGQEQEAPDPGEPDDTVFDPMIDAVERAKQVEETHSDRVHELNRALDSIEGAGERQADDDTR